MIGPMIREGLIHVGDRVIKNYFGKMEDQLEELRKEIRKPWHEREK